MGFHAAIRDDGEFEAILSSLENVAASAISALEIRSQMSVSLPAPLETRLRVHLLEARARLEAFEPVLRESSLSRTWGERAQILLHAAATVRDATDTVRDATDTVRDATDTVRDATDTVRDATDASP